MDCRVTYVGTATFLLEIGGLQLLTDPVLDPAGSRDTLRVRLLGRLGLDFPLVKLTDPALSTDELPALDAILLSHDEHYDNLDREGRALLRRVPLTLTTPSGAKRLGGTAKAPPKGVRLAELVGAQTLVPAHYDGWVHFTEPRRSAEQALSESFDGRVVWLQTGEPTPLEV